MIKSAILIIILSINIFTNILTAEDVDKTINTPGLGNMRFSDVANKSQNSFPIDPNKPNWLLTRICARPVAWAAFPNNDKVP